MGESVLDVGQKYELKRRPDLFNLLIQNNCPQ